MPAAIDAFPEDFQTEVAFLVGRSLSRKFKCPCLSEVCLPIMDRNFPFIEKQTGADDKFGAL
jgi:hypothetical protein